MKFSVLTPVYNVEKYIDECIVSVLGQTYSEFEFILVDDGSPDNSGRICDKYAEKDSRIRVIHKTNGGLISARRAAIKEACGDYVVFLDSDDYLELNALQCLKDHIEKTECDCVYYNFRQVCNDKSIICYSCDIEAPFFVEDKKELYRIVFLSSQMNPLWRKAVRRTLLTNDDYSPYYHISHGEDLLQSIEILKNSKNGLFVPDCLYNYRVNPTSITHTITPDKFSRDFVVRQKVLDFLLSEKVWTEKDYLEYRDYSIYLFVQSKLLPIVNFDIPFKQKKLFFENLEQQKYYREFLRDGKYNKQILGKKRIVFDLYRQKRYKLLVSIMSTYNWFAKFYRKLRKR